MGRRILIGMVVCLMACGGSGSPDPAAPDTGADLQDTDPGADSGDTDGGPEGTPDAAPDAEPDIPDIGPDAPNTDCEQGQGADCAYVSAVALSAEGLAVVDGLSVTGVGGRELPVLLRYSPDAPQPLPVIVWSHGGGYDSEGQRSGTRWSVRLAKAGYAVLHVAHVAPTPAQLREICAFVGVDDRAECMDVSLGGGEEPESNPFTSAAVARPYDMVAVLEALPRIASGLSERAGVQLDVDTVAVAGWSAGSQGPVQLAGAHRHVSATLPAFEVRDPRPRAFLAISPQGPGSSGFFAEPGEPSSWDGVRGPMLVMTGDGDEKDTNDLTGPVRRQAFENMPPGGKYLFYSTLVDAGISHGTYNLGLDTPSDGIDRLHAGLISTAVAFLDAHLRDRPEAQRWLAGQDAVRVTRGQAQWLSK